MIGKKFGSSGNLVEPASWSRGCKEDDRTRPPPRGGWRGHGWDVHAWQKTSSRGRDGGSTAGSRRTKGDSTLATNVASLLRMHHAAVCIDGRPQYSSRRPFHLLRSLNPGVFLPPGGTPLSEGGDACARSILRILPHKHTIIIPVHYNSRRTKSFQWLENSARFSNDWKNFSAVFQRMEKIFHAKPPEERAAEGFPRERGRPVVRMEGAPLGGGGGQGVAGGGGSRTRGVVLVVPSRWMVVVQWKGCGKPAGWL